MSEAVAPTKSIVVERTMPHSPAKVWRSLTQSPLIAEWRSGQLSVRDGNHRHAAMTKAG